MNGMSLIVKTVTRVTAGVIFIFGCYIASSGPTSIGGGLAGGVIISLAFILFVLAYGRTHAEERLGKQIALNIMAIGALLFLFNTFFCCYVSKGLQGILCNMAIMLIVGAGLFVVFLDFVTFRVKAMEGKI